VSLSYLNLANGVPRATKEELHSVLDDGSVVVMSGRAAILGRAATYKDLELVPDGLKAEILEGDLWVSPHPTPRHQHVGMRLVLELGPPFQDGRGGPGGWYLLYEPELAFDGDVLVPDLAGWRRERNLKLMDRAPIIDSPDWVCEIISRSTEKVDRSLKKRIYARHGIQYLWFVDPNRRRLEVMKLDSGEWTTILVVKDDSVAAAEPFDALPLSLARLWP
jgi:Uma2 family endonuclease